MEHEAQYYVANSAIKNDSDFIGVINSALTQALCRFNHEKKSPLETKIDYASTKIVCGYSIETDAYIIKITAHNWERNFKPVEDGE